jgi:hypothetical protein
MRLVAVGIAIAIVVFIVTGSHVLFLPLLFVPLGLFGVGHRGRQNDGYDDAARRTFGAEAC